MGPRGEGGGAQCRLQGRNRVVVVGFWPLFSGMGKVKNGARNGIGEKMQDDESGVAESDGDRRNLLQRS